MSDAAAILADLVRRPSVNPMGRDVAGPDYLEGRIGDYLGRRLSAAGLAWARQTVSPGRDNIWALLPATRPDAAVVLWDVHQDTVPIDGMTIDPFLPLVRDGRLSGRGSCDVKGGMAAMLVALERLQAEDGSRGVTVLFVATVNEEFGFSGARGVASLLDRLSQNAPVAEQDQAAADLVAGAVPGRTPVMPAMAVVAEPTELDLVTQHKGAVRWRVIARGRACHSSFPERGVNAIYPAARAVLAIERLAGELLTRQPDHPCGPPTLSAGTIHGGFGVNLVPDAVVLELDRRLVPGEDPVAARQEVIDRIRSACGGDLIEHEEPFLESSGLSAEGPGAAAAARRLRDAAFSVGIESSLLAARYGTNACIYAATGIPSVVFGPGSIAQAHTADEWIELAQVATAAEIFVALVRNG